MKAHRIYAVILRHLYEFRHSYDRLSDVFYWPTIDLLLWGLTSVYIRTLSHAQFSIITMIISGILLWIIIWRSQYEITVGLLTELWNKNLINLFVAPLKLSEIIVGYIISGILKGFISLVYASIVAFILYKVQLFVYGWYMLPFALILVMNGWWIGFLVAGMIMRYGTRIQTLAWSLVMVLSPFSAIYYPVSALPEWAQKVSAVVPASYVFEGAREVLKTGHLDMHKVLMGILLNIIYLIPATYYLQSSFKAVLKNGLVKVY